MSKYMFTTYLHCKNEICRKKGSSAFQAINFILLSRKKQENIGKIIIFLLPYLKETNTLMYVSRSARKVFMLKRGPWGQVKTKRQDH